jgi:hypothetical protein
MSVRAIKACKHELIPYLFQSINCSMNSGTFPDCFKQAKVRPLHKSGNKRHVENYRPISMLSPVNKILEKVIYHRLLTCINNHGRRSIAGYFLSFCAGNETELVEGVQVDLTWLKRYFTTNKLTLNAFKTSYLVFRALNKKLLDMPLLF